MFLGPNVSKTEAEKTEDIVRSTAEFSLGAREHCTIWHVTVSQREALVNSHLRQAGSTCSAMSRTFSLPIFPLQAVHFARSSTATFPDAVRGNALTNRIAVGHL